MARGRKPSPGMPSPDPRPSVANNAQGGEAAGGGGPVMEPPDGMGPKAAAKWREIVPLIQSMTTLRDSDRDAIRQYCEAVVLREKAVAELEDAPLVLMTPNGAHQTNPLLKVISQAETVMMKLAERFGLDPASRQRLKFSQAKGSSPFMDYLKGGRDRRKPPVAGAAAE